jgi:hypothetical protein
VCDGLGLTSDGVAQIEPGRDFKTRRDDLSSSRLVPRDGEGLIRILSLTVAGAITAALGVAVGDAVGTLAISATATAAWLIRVCSTPGGQSPPLPPLADCGHAHVSPLGMGPSVAVAPATCTTGGPADHAASAD